MKKPYSMVVILIVIAVVGFNRVAQSPGFSTIRSVDVVQMTGSGVCIGVALALLFMLRGRQAQ